MHFRIWIQDMDPAHAIRIGIPDMDSEYGFRIWVQDMHIRICDSDYGFRINDLGFAIQDL